MDDNDRATQPQIELIESLYANLRIRNTSLYGGAPPAQLSKQHASEVIDVLTLRKLSGQLRRPVTVDLTNPVQVREQLTRLEQLTDVHHTRHTAARAKRAEHLRNASQIADSAEREAQAAAVPQVRVLPHLRRREDRQPRVRLTQEELAARAARLDAVKEPRLDAAGRYSDATGYGSAASYNGSDNGSTRDAPQLTDQQERKIIELQDAGDDTTVSHTVLEASDYLDQAFAPAEPPPPTERQLAYLHKLERQAGKTEEQLSHPGTRQSASRRIQRYLDAARDDAAGVGAEFAAAVALTCAASPQSIRELTSAESAERDTAWSPNAHIFGEEHHQDAHATR